MSDPIDFRHMDAERDHVQPSAELINSALFICTYYFICRYVHFIEKKNIQHALNTIWIQTSWLINVIIFLPKKKSDILQLKSDLLSLFMLPTAAHTYQFQITQGLKVFGFFFFLNKWVKN